MHFNVRLAYLYLYVEFEHRHQYVVVKFISKNCGIGISSQIFWISKMIVARRIMYR